MLVVCSVCYELLNRPSIVDRFTGRIVTTNCGHVFHASCINQFWKTLAKNARTQGIEVKYSCPVCRSVEIHPAVFELHLVSCHSPIVKVQKSEQIQGIVTQQEAEIKKLEMEINNIRKIVVQLKIEKDRQPKV